jgi:hypothetical protein
MVVVRMRGPRRKRALQPTDFDVASGPTGATPPYISGAWQHVQPPEQNAQDSRG